MSLKNNRLAVYPEDELDETPVVDHETSRHRMRQNSAKSLTEKINESHDLAVSLSGEMQNKLLCFVNQARSTGLFLMTLEAETKHGEWLSLFRSKSNSKSVLNFSDQTGRTYMKVARAFSEPITKLADGVKTLADVLRSVGALPQIEGHGPQLTHDFNPFTSAVKSLGKLQESFATIFEKKPLADWDDKSRKDLKDQLEKIVEVYRQL